MNYNVDEPIPYRILAPGELSANEYAWVKYGTQPNGPVEPDEFDELGDVSDGPVDYWYGKE